MLQFRRIALPCLLLFAIGFFAWNAFSAASGEKKDCVRSECDLARY